MLGLGKIKFELASWNISEKVVIYNFKKPKGLEKARPLKTMGFQRTDIKFVRPNRICPRLVSLKWQPVCKIYAISR